MRAGAGAILRSTSSHFASQQNMHLRLNYYAVRPSYRFLIDCGTRDAPHSTRGVALLFRVLGHDMTEPLPGEFRTIH
jgi:hypothetical protein